MRTAIACGLALPRRLRRPAATTAKPAAAQTPATLSPPFAPRNPSPAQAAAATPAAAGRPTRTGWFAHWLRPTRRPSAPAPAPARIRRAPTGRHDSPFTAESCPGLPPELLKLLNTPLQDCDPAALRLLFSAFARYVASVMPPGMATLGLTSAEDVFDHINGRLGGMLDGVTLAPLAPGAPDAAAAEALHASSPDGAPAEPAGTPPPAVTDTTPPAATDTAPPVPSAALPPGPFAAPASAPAGVTDALPIADADAGPALPPSQAPSLPDGFLAILAATFQDAHGSAGPLPTAPPPATPDAPTIGAPATAATTAPGAPPPRGPVHPSRSTRSHHERFRRRRGSLRLHRRRLPRCAKPQSRRFVIISQHKRPFRRRCYAACAGPP